MANSSYVGIDVSKDRLDVAVLGEERVWQVDNTQAVVVRLVEQLQKLQPKLIAVEATGGYQRAVMEALFWAALAVAVVNPARQRIIACLKEEKKILDLRSSSLWHNKMGGKSRSRS